MESIEEYTNLLQESDYFDSPTARISTPPSRSTSKMYS